MVLIVLWLSAALIAAVSNLDNLAVGTAFGIRGTRISSVANLTIATVTMAATAGAITFGRAVSHVIAPSMGSAVGSAIVIAIGAGTVVTSLSTIRAPEPSPRAASMPARDLRQRSTISPREALALAVALSLNNLGTGVGAGVAGIPALATTLLAGAFSLLAVGGASRIGWSLGRPLLGRGAPLVAGLMLVAVGGATATGVA